MCDLGNKKRLFLTTAKFIKWRETELGVGGYARTNCTISLPSDSVNRKKDIVRRSYVQA